MVFAKQKDKELVSKISRCKQAKNDKGIVLHLCKLEIELRTMTLLLFSSEGLNTASTIFNNKLTGKTEWDKVGTCLLCIPCLPFVCCGAAVVGTYDSVRNAITNHRISKEHKKEPRIEGINIYSLKMWNENVQKYDQYVRKILAIKEANDIPRQFWSELMDDAKLDLSTYLNKRNVKKDFYKAIKDDVVNKALYFYMLEYMKLHNMKSMEEAKRKIDEIVYIELYSKDK